MINLLPPKEKEELLLEKNKNLVIVLGNVVLISLISLILVLFSVRFYILGEINYQKFVLANTEKKYQTPDFVFFKNFIDKHNGYLVGIESFYEKQFHVREVLKTIAQIQRPNGLYLTSVEIKNKESNKISVSIYGISDNRDNLLAFKDSIENNGKIKNIYFPPNNWVKSFDLNFYLTFDYESKE